MNSGVQNSRFSKIDLLETFWQNVNTKLSDISKIMWFNHSAIKVETSWQDTIAIQQLKKDNEHITSLFYQTGIAGVYAIWENINNENAIVYFGQTLDNISHQRVYNHFITKDYRTGSKLDEVKFSVKQGGKLGLTFVEIHPKELRQYVEQKLIQHHFSDGIKKTWNKVGRRKVKGLSKLK